MENGTLAGEQWDQHGIRKEPARREVASRARQGHGASGARRWLGPLGLTNTPCTVAGHAYGGKWGMESFVGKAVV